MTDLQIEACALRFYGDSRGPMSLTLIGTRLGRAKNSVSELIGRGLARIRSNGYEVDEVVTRLAS
jgi:hypothetical protein